LRRPGLKPIFDPTPSDGLTTGLPEAGRDG
jgi:hypothetical protein